MEMRLNCWEYKKCGYGPGITTKPNDMICPAVSEGRLNGIHNGTQAGRACWVVTGTYCNGDVQGKFVQNTTPV